MNPGFLKVWDFLGPIFSEIKSEKILLHLFLNFIFAVNKKNKTQQMKAKLMLLVFALSFVMI